MENFSMSWLCHDLQLGVAVIWSHFIFQKESKLNMYVVSSLAPEKCGYNFEVVLFKHVLVIHIINIPCRLSEDSID